MMHQRWSTYSTLFSCFASESQYRCTIMTFCYDNIMFSLGCLFTASCRSAKWLLRFWNFWEQIAWIICFFPIEVREESSSAWCEPFGFSYKRRHPLVIREVCGDGAGQKMELYPNLHWFQDWCMSYSWIYTLHIPPLGVAQVGLGFDCMEVMVHGHFFFRSMSDDGRWGVGLVGGTNPWASPGHQKMVVNSFDVLAIFQWSHLGYTQ